MKTISKEDALHRCAAHCSTAERCIHDIRKKLDKWEIPSDTQQQIITQLQKENFLNEERYCKAFVNDKTKFSHWGKNKIIYALRAKEIDHRIIATAVNEIEPEQNEKIVMLLLKKKMPTIKGKDAYEIRMKLMRFAAGRGFELSVINRCLEKLPI